MLDFLRGKRTVIWNVLNLVVLTMSAVEMQYGIPDDYYEIWIVVFGIVNLILRYDTTTPIWKKE